MTTEPRLDPDEIDWLLQAHFRSDLVVPGEIEDHLHQLGLMERKRSWVAISDAGRNSLARNGDLRHGDRRAS
jgi:hypothetical protein